MKPLRVALIIKDRAANRLRDTRMQGSFSYPVPEFTWEHVVLGKGHRTDRANYRGFDVLVHEDAGNWGEWYGSGPPVVFHSIDSTLSDRHLAERVTQAAQSDLVLVEQGPLAPYRDRRGKPAERLLYCVNDRVFRPLAKAIDVAFHCAISSPGSDGRRVSLDVIIDWATECGACISYGPLGGSAYAVALGEARIVVNWSRVPGNRPHRLLDTMAAGACLVTGPYGALDSREPDFVPGEHLWRVTSPHELPPLLDMLLSDERWSKYAKASLTLVRPQHTWATRAVELRALLTRRLGL